jgi:hypothetical protein
MGYFLLTILSDGHNIVPLILLMFISFYLEIIFKFEKISFLKNVKFRKTKLKNDLNFKDEKKHELVK